MIDRANGCFDRPSRSPIRALIKRRAKLANGAPTLLNNDERLNCSRKQLQAILLRILIDSRLSTPISRFTRARLNYAIWPGITFISIEDKGFPF